MSPPGPFASKPTRKTKPAPPSTSQPKGAWRIWDPITGPLRALGVRGRPRPTSRSPGTKSMLQLVIFAVLGMLVAVPSTTYDSGRKVKLKGAVTRIDWVNPHAFFFINVQDSVGTITNWAL